ncbi:MAG: hypothetical protein J6V41_01425 [Kiritimatiellae bacterium]|nr:hypothetical protein [Kiritimatiellia bacterium]
MNSKIIFALHIFAFFTAVVFADFDNFTNWGDVPLAADQNAGISSELLASFPGFEVGRRNGAPSSTTAPLVNGEFFTYENDNKVVVVSTPVEFPQHLKSKQAIKITLASRPLTIGATLKFAIVSEKLKRNEFMTYRFEAAERPLCIKLNGQIIYHRNITDGWAEQEVFIPFFFFNEDENNLEIINEGNLVLAFDYLRLQHSTEGQKTFIAISPNQMLPKPIATGFPIEYVELTLPSTALADPPLLGNAVAPSDFKAAFSAMNEFYALGYARNKKYGEEFNNWAVQLANILKNKKIPYVRIKGDLTKVNEKTAMWFFTRFGCIVGGWVCDNEVSAEILAKYITGVKVVAVDVLDVEKVKTAGNASNTYTRTYTAPIAVKGGRQDRVYGEFLQHYLKIGKNFSPAFVPYLTPLKPLINKQAVIDNSEETITAILQILMHGGTGAIIDSGESGKNIVLNDKQQPIWQTYRKLFDLTSGEGKLLPMALSLNKHVESSPLEDCYYVATKNSDEEVTVVIAAGRKDIGREARVLVPLPWIGAATVSHQNISIDEIGQSAPIIEKPIQKNLKVLSPSVKKGVEIGSMKGVLSYEFSTASLTVLKIQRYKSKKEKGNEKESKVVKKEVPEKDIPMAKVFNQIPYNFKLTPLVSSTNIEDYVTFSKEKVSVYGPKGTGIVFVKPSKIEELNCFSAPESFDFKGAKFVMRNIPIWDDNSLFLEFSGASRKQRPSYILDVGIKDYLNGAKGIIFFANATPIVSSISEQLSASKDPVRFMIGSKTKPLVFDIDISKPSLIYVPYKDIAGVMNDPSMVYLMMDEKEERDIRLELNYLSAVHELEGNAPKLAVRYDLYERALYCLVEGDTGKPLDITFRMKNKFILSKAVPVLPRGFAQVKLDINEESNKYRISIDKLPNNDQNKGNVTKYFPAIEGDAPQGRSRVLIKFSAER